MSSGCHRLVATECVAPQGANADDDHRLDGATRFQLRTSEICNSVVAAVWMICSLSGSCQTCYGRPRSLQAALCLVDSLDCWRRLLFGSACETSVFHHNGFLVARIHALSRHRIFSTVAAEPAVTENETADAAERGTY
jgi:hypothetical protein